MPPAHREALRLAASEVETDVLTREAFRILGRPPGWPLRALDRVTSGVAGALGMVAFAVWSSVTLINWGLDRGEPWFHVNAWDWLAEDEQLLVVWGLTFSVLLVVYVLGAFGRRRVAELRGLQRALSARPPTRAGGAASCRQCGAPLSVPRRATGVRCAYCRTDNLVKIPADWLERRAGAVAQVAREAKAALGEHYAELRRLRLRLGLRVVVIALLAALLLGSTFGRWLRGETGVFDLRAALRGPRELFDVRAGSALTGAPRPAAPRVPVDQCRSGYVLHAGEDVPCHDGECAAGWFVALHAGESLRLSLGSAGRISFYSHYKNRGWTASYGRAEYWGGRLLEQAADASRAARFVAPSTSWYRVELRQRSVDERLELCAEIR